MLASGGGAGGAAVPRARMRVTQTQNPQWALTARLLASDLRGRRRRPQNRRVRLQRGRRGTGALAAAAEQTGGLFLRYDPAAVTGQLDQIRAAQQARGAEEQRTDAPVVVLIAALMLTALLGISLLAVRR